MTPGFQIIEREIVADLKNKLDKAGIFYRIFSRVKEKSSIEEKLLRKGDYSEEKKMQDIIGVRIVTYFHDDVSIIYNFLKKSGYFENEQIDTPALDVFKPKRTNLVFKLKPDLVEIFEQCYIDFNESYFGYLDTTYEIQLRTILSEGWHEIDHNLRYKCQANWIELNDEERLFNGIYASLETSDHTLQKMFDDIAYSHYKNNHIENMIRTKFRLKFGQETLNKDLAIILKNKSFFKSVFRLEREHVVNSLLNQFSSFPLNINSLLFFINFYWLKDKKITSLTPSPLIDDFKEYRLKL